MTPCWVELNLPQIPEHLLVFENPATQRLETNRLVKDSGYGKKQFKNGKELIPCAYTNVELTHEPLMDWLKENLDFLNEKNKFFYQYQTAGSHIVHTDLKRRFALNYILDEGGDNVVTAWYQQNGMPLIRQTKQKGQQTDTGNVDYDELVEVDRVVCRKGRWYLISNGILHDVDTVQTLRRSVSLGFFGETVIDDLEQYWVKRETNV